MASNSNSDPRPGRDSAGRRRVEVGFALIDLALESIALDEGAASILSAVSGEGPSHAGIPQALPPAMVEQIRANGLPEPGSNGMRLLAGNQCYSVRAHAMRSTDAAAPAGWTILRFERDAEASDAPAELSTTCGLTDREEEALRALALGLTSKEVAQRMKISLSTVKVFLRLIKIKTGARNRADIVARLLSPASPTSPDHRDRAWHSQDAVRTAP